MLTEAKANNNRDNSWPRLELLEARSYLSKTLVSIRNIGAIVGTYLVIILIFVLLRYQ